MARSSRSGVFGGSYIEEFWRENLKIITAWNESENNNETVFTTGRDITN
jgi:hypothetical protein